MESKRKFVPFTDLLVAKPVQVVEIESLVNAAKLYLEGRVGEDAFVHSRQSPLKYKFVPSPLKRFNQLGVREAAALLFGEGLRPDQFQFLPYILTKLCEDLLGEETVGRARYHSKSCNYTDDETGLHINLSKSIDYCSYHDISVSFVGQDWKITIMGCWRGSQQDPGPVHHPSENSYCGNVVGSSGAVTHIMHNGERSEDGFALWGIDASRLVTHQNKATA